MLLSLPSFSPVAAKRGRYTHERRALIVEDAKRAEASRARAVALLPAHPHTRDLHLERLTRSLIAVDLKHTEHTAEFYQSVPRLEAAFLVRPAVVT